MISMLFLRLSFLLLLLPSFLCLSISPSIYPSIRLPRLLLLCFSPVPPRDPRRDVARK